MSKILKNIISNIDNFDYMYEMSDSNNVYDEGYNKQNLIIQQLKLYKNIPKDFKEKLDDNGKLCWERYFKNKL